MSVGLPQRISLFHSPSRVLKVAGALSVVPDVNFWMKLDSELGKFGGGSKIRNLEFLLGDCVDLCADKIVCPGTILSNFVWSLNSYGALYDLHISLYLLNSPRTPGGIILDRLKGLESRKTVWRLSSRIRLSIVHLLGLLCPKAMCRLTGIYFLPVGGASPTGCLGPYQAAAELMRQVEDGAIPMPAAIVVPVGSGGLISGLYAGLVAGGFNGKLVGVRVGRGPSVLFIKWLARRTLTLVVGSGCNQKQRDWGNVTLILTDDFKFGGYAQSTAELSSFIQRVKSSCDIQLDGIYTSKTVYAAVALAKAGTLTGNILLWDTRAGERNADHPT